LYIKWGSLPEAPLKRSIASLREVHPELPYHVVDLPANANLLDKAKMLDLSPFESTLFLDADTVVLDRLDFGFTKSERFGVACCICECPWARRYGGLGGDSIEYNTGVLFFTRQMQSLFEAWKSNAATLDSSITFRTGGDKFAKMPFNDQGGFAQAIEELSINPFVLPLNWNLRPIWQKTLFGPVKIWHDYSPVPDSLKRWTDSQKGEQKLIECLRMQ
jgi:hypothetical protein